MTFYERLTELRREKGLTQKQIVDELNLGKNSFGEWKKGAIPVPLSAYPNPTLCGERCSFKPKDTPYLNR